MEEDQHGNQKKSLHYRIKRENEVLQHVNTSASLAYYSRDNFFAKELHTAVSEAFHIYALAHSSFLTKIRDPHQLAQERDTLSRFCSY